MIASPPPDRRPASEHSSLRTDPLLLFRLRNWKDRESWTAFYRLYYRFVYGFVRRQGLGHADSEEVTQEVFQKTAERIHTFESDPSRGRFRGWLIRQARWRIADKRRARRPHEREGVPAREADELADPSPGGTDWERQWRHHLLEEALRRLGRTMAPRTLQIFDLVALKGRPPEQVARELGVKTSQVYLVKHRCCARVRDEIQRLSRAIG